ncbi:hypothetical protein EC836_101628 [Erwinia sp. JUb26]|nr:hypothetical protein EC836_101628 [Erwinia sp. JUb26]
MLVTMSNKELHRLPVIQAVIEKRLDELVRLWLY